MNANELIESLQRLTPEQKKLEVKTVFYMSGEDGSDVERDVEIESVRVSEVYKAVVLEG